MDNIRHKTIWGFFYKLAERGATQIISFVVQIILARMLLPEEFGTIALLMVLMSILDVFVTYGFGNSLVVDKNSDDLDFSTCLYFGVSLSVVLYIIIFLLSPYISEFFYARSEFCILIKIMALRMPISAVNSVQYAYISKKMQFMLFFYATLIGTLLSGIISITIAFLGFGVWALVALYLSNAFISTLSLWYFSEWRPKWLFSFSRLRIIYDYGWKILFVGLIDTIYTQIYSLVIAKKYTTSDLAYYNRGNSFPNIGVSLVEPAIDGVLFPSLSNCNNDNAMMKAVTKRVTNVSTYLMGVLMFMLMAIAKPLVLILLTEKWLTCVVFLQIACIAGFFRPMQIINNCVIRSSGKSGLLLKINIIKKGLGVLLLILSFRYGIIAIAMSLVVTNIISTIINIFPNRRILLYGYKEQTLDFIKNITVPLIMGCSIWFLTFLSIPNEIILLAQITVGGFVLVGLSKAMKVESYCYLINLLQTKILCKKNEQQHSRK